MADADTIAGIDGGSPRPLSKLVSDIGNGYEMNFVSNEVYLLTDNPAEKDAFVARWNGRVVFETDANSELGVVGGPQYYLIQVDASTADTTNLAGKLSTLDPRIHGPQRISDSSALKLLALIARERQENGLRVGLNALVNPQAFFQRSTSEASAGARGPDGVSFSRNSYVWNYMDHTPDVAGDSLFQHDTGVAEAWRILEATGKLRNRVGAAILDGGFIPNADFPEGWRVIGEQRTGNPDPSHCNNPDAPISNACEWHGTHVALTGFGLPDNGFGVAGPGGPVTNLVMIQSPALDFSSIYRYATEQLPRAVVGTRIINMSFSLPIPAGWCVFVCEPLDELAKALDRAGILLVAAAGNNNIDVDATDEICAPFCVSFEETAVIPCELDKVLCVGATGWNDNGKVDFSNYGHNFDAENSVDIFAPGVLWSVADPTTADEALATPANVAGIVQGTSFASPFVAGVAALVWAADPTLTPEQVRQVLRDTAHTDSRTPFQVRRRINALAAVRSVLGDTPPFLAITLPSTTVTAGQDSVVLQATAEDLDDAGPLPVSWRSDISAALGSGNPLTLGPDTLPVGVHRITATTRDSAGHTVSRTATITVQNYTPRVFIDAANSVFTYQGLPIVFRGRSSDLNEPGDVLPAENVGWYRDGVLIGTGYELTIPAGTLPVNDYIIRFSGTDSFGSTGDDYVLLTVQADPANLPPTVNITSPTTGQSFAAGAGGYATVQFKWTASDDHDVIGFSNLTWTTRVNGGAEEPLTVYRLVTPGPGGTSIVIYYADLRAEPGVGTTTHQIFLRAKDSEGAESNPSRVTVTVTQLI